MEVEWVEGLIEIIENYRIFFFRKAQNVHSDVISLQFLSLELFNTPSHTVAHKSSEISRLSNGRVSSECCWKASRDSSNCRRVWEVCSLDFHVKVERMCHTRVRERKAKMFMRLCLLIFHSRYAAAFHFQLLLCMLVEHNFPLISLSAASRRVCRRTFFFSPLSRAQFEFPFRLLFSSLAHTTHCMNNKNKFPLDLLYIVLMSLCAVIFIVVA